MTFSPLNNCATFGGSTVWKRTEDPWKAVYIHRLSWSNLEQINLVLLGAVFTVAVAVPTYNKGYYSAPQRISYGYGRPYYARPYYTESQVGATKGYLAAPVPAVAAVVSQTPVLSSISRPEAYTRFHAQDEFGQYQYGYASADGQAKTEIRGIDGSVAGRYSYVDPDGKSIELSYVADKDGFRASGSHLPKGPEIPDELEEAYEEANDRLAEAKARSAAKRGYTGQKSQTSYAEQPRPAQTARLVAYPVPARVVAVPQPVRIAAMPAVIHTARVVAVPVVPVVQRVQPQPLQPQPLQPQPQIVQPQPTYASGSEVKSDDDDEQHDDGQYRPEENAASEDHKEEEQQEEKQGGDHHHHHHHHHHHQDEGKKGDEENKENEEGGDDQGKDGGDDQNNEEGNDDQKKEEGSEHGQEEEGNQDQQHKGDNGDDAEQESAAPSAAGSPGSVQTVQAIQVLPVKVTGISGPAAPGPAVPRPAPAPAAPVQAIPIQVVQVRPVSVSVPVRRVNIGAPQPVAPAPQPAAPQQAAAVFSRPQHAPITVNVPPPVNGYSGIAPPRPIPVYAPAAGAAYAQARPLIGAPGPQQVAGLSHASVQHAHPNAHQKSGYAFQGK